MRVPISSSASLPLFSHGSARLSAGYLAVALSLQAVLAAGAPSEQPGSFGEGKRALDLLDEIHRAHVRSPGIIVPFVGGAHTKHTFGDWHQTWRADPGDAHATLSRSRGELRVFAGAEEASTEAVVGVMARCGTANRLDIFVNRRFVGSVTLDCRDFSYASLVVQEGLRQGENIVELLPKLRPGEAGDRAPTVDIAYLALIPVAEDADPGGTQTVPPIPAHSSGALELREGTTLSFNLFLPEETRLVVEIASAEARAELEIAVSTDSAHGVPPVVDSVSETRPVSLALGRFAGHAAALSLRASGGDLVLRGARLEWGAALPSPRPWLPPVKNAVIVLVDTLRRDRLKVYNAATPVLARGMARLARRGIVFDNAFAQSSWTKPSVASLLTGRFPRSHTAATHSAVLPEGIPTLPARLHESGVETAGFVANGYISERFGFGAGWDRLLAYGTADRPARGRHLVRDALAWMRSARQERFFVYIHTTDVHAPYLSPRSFWGRYDALAYNGVVRPADTASLLNRIRGGSFLLAQRDLQRLKALYNGAVAYHDLDIDRLMQGLAASGMLDDTVVVFTSDHGEEFMDHGSVGHGQSLFEELVHVPLIVHLPKAYGGGRRHVARPVGLVDLPSTLYDLMDIAPPPGLEGRSFADALSSESPETRFDDIVVMESPSQKMTALRQGRFKAVVNGFETALYDVLTDPGETVDVRAGYPITAMAMIDRLGFHLRGTAFLNRAPPPAVGVADIELDPETRLRLQQLGYIEE